MTQETAAQKIKNQHKSCTENNKTEELKGNQCMNNSTRTMKDHQQIKKYLWHGYVAQV